MDVIRRQGQLEKWGAWQVRQIAGRMTPPTSEVIRELIANDTATSGYMAMVKLIAQARAIKTSDKQAGEAT